jgi:hypothetical protein
MELMVVVPIELLPQLVGLVQGLCHKAQSLLNGCESRKSTCLGPTVQSQIQIILRNHLEFVNLLLFVVALT